MREDYLGRGNMEGKDKELWARTRCGRIYNIQFMEREKKNVRKKKE